MPVTSAISVSTIRSSMSVTPEALDSARRGREPLFVAPTDNVGSVPFSAGLSVRAQRNQIRFVSVVTRKLVEIRVAPRIERSILRQIRAGPLIDAIRLHAQRVQPHFGG